MTVLAVQGESWSIRDCPVTPSPSLAILPKSGENRAVSILPKTVLPPLIGVLLLAIFAVGCGVGGIGPAEESSEPLRLGLLLNFSAGAPERSADRKRAFDLAVMHVNQAGGVFGRPVEVVEADSTLDPEQAVAEARRLVEEEGIHALVGPTSSANTLQVAQRVTGPAGIPTVSPSASSPLLTGADDRDFLFRTVLSDSAQGPALAGLAEWQGMANIGLIYADDAWGQGLFSTFREHWEGDMSSAVIQPGQAEFLAPLQETAAAGAKTLVLMTFEAEAIAILQQALESGIYDRFVFTDALKTPSLVRTFGGEVLGGMYGTGAGAAPGSPSTAAWEQAYLDSYGALPEFHYVMETYDATIALALAAEAAGSVDGDAIQAQLRAIGSEPGTKIIAGPEGIARALETLREGGAVDYDGAAVTMDWDERGDLRTGHVGIWRFTPDETIEEVEVVHVQHLGATE